MHKLTAAAGHHFLADLLTQRSVVIDLGSNKGEFASFINNTFGCTCYAVEPDPRLYEQIKESDILRKFNYAITAREEDVAFYISKRSVSSSLYRSSAEPFEIKEKIIVKGINLEKLLEINKIAEVDLLKVDIEGAEIELFDSLPTQSLAAFKQITVEFHDFIASLGIAKDVMRTINKIKDAGFYCLMFSRPSHLHEDVLFVNKKHVTNLADRAKMYFFEFCFLRIRHFFIYLKLRACRVMSKLKGSFAKDSHE